MLLYRGDDTHNKPFGVPRLRTTILSDAMSTLARNDAAMDATIALIMAPCDPPDQVGVLCGCERPIRCQKQGRRDSNDSLYASGVVGQGRNRLWSHRSDVKSNVWRLITWASEIEDERKCQSIPAAASSWCCSETQRLIVAQPMATIIADGKDAFSYFPSGAVGCARVR